MSAQPKALLFTTIQGHASISEAIVHGLKQKKWDVLSASYIDPALVLYRWIYRNAPQLCKYYYNSLGLPGIAWMISTYTYRTHSPTVAAAIQDFIPDVIISVTYGFDSSILSLQKKLQKQYGNAPQYINIVVDPRTYFRVGLCENADINCVFDEKTMLRAKNEKPDAKTAVTGWFVRPQFRSTQSKKHVRKELGFDTEVLTLLFAAGSEGETKTAKLIPSLLLQNKPLHIILACGSNAMLKEQFTTLAAQLPQNSPVKLTVLSFTKEIYKYLHAADLVIGKAGPNMIFETVAGETPFFATNHIAGQEDGNLEMIREYRIGYVEENLGKAEQLLQHIVEHPEELQQFAPHLKSLAQYNDNSIDRLVETISTLQSESALTL
jgi:UDP-N-acetylglucosamine:LPS N-acetylglucosamine transferase